MGSVILLLALGVVTGPHAPYVFIPDTSIGYALSAPGYPREQHGITYYGHLDASGEFMLDPKKPADYPREGGSMRSVRLPRGGRLMEVRGPSNRCYEYCSGLLVPGRVTSSKFIPDEGGWITHFLYYSPAKDPRFIYNLPGRLELAPQAFPNPLPDRSRYMATSQPKEPEFPPPGGAVEYGFVPDTSNLRYRLQGRFVCYGRLDESGEFQYIRDPVVPLCNTGKPPHGEPLISPRLEGKAVYQFRSGMLIPGQIEKGKFIPDLGGVIIPFTRYRYSPDARPIYNLPGRFEPVKK